MLLKTIKLLIAIVAAIMCSNATAQVGGLGFGGGGYGSFGTLGGAGIATDNCGRGITNGQAASLWAGYCTESCGYTGGAGGFAGGGYGAASYGVASYGGGDCGAASYDIVSYGGGGHGCRLGQKLRNLFGGLCGRRSAGGFGGASVLSAGSYGSIGDDCFGYPSSGCGCGGGYGGGHGGCRLFSRFGGGGFLTRLLGGVGGCLCRGSQTAAPSYAVNYVPVTFQASANECGTSGSYFNEFVGPEYGTAGIQSAVSGCATGACGGSVMTGYQNAGGYQDAGAGYQDAGYQGYQDAGAMGYSGNSVNAMPSYDQGAVAQPMATGNSFIAQPDPSANSQEIIGEAIGGIDSGVGGGSVLGSGSR